MVVDSSVLVAIFLKENGYEKFVYAMAEADHRLVSAASYLETSIVIANRRGQSSLLELDAMVAGLEIEVVPVSSDHVEVGREAYVRFSKGHHPASLNFGDCFSYALAKLRREPLLFTGDDFSQTDIESAL